jgi:hypothetical protein
MQQALEALELLARCEHPLTKIQVRKPRDGGSIVTVYPHQVATDAAELLRERLAQPEQEPDIPERPYEIGARLARQGHGISAIWGAVQSDSDMAEAQRGYENALAEQEPSEAVKLSRAAQALYAKHPTYRGATPLTWDAAPIAVKREWLDKAKQAAQPEQCQYPDCKCATENPCLKGLAQPVRTHWEGCDEVHPECKQPRREWVACKTLCELCVKRGYTFCANAVKTTPINAPPQRKPLTEEEIERACVPLGAAMLSFTEVARAIEAAHGIKENT